MCSPQHKNYTYLVKKLLPGLAPAVDVGVGILWFLVHEWDSESESVIFSIFLTYAVVLADNGNL